MSSSVTPTTLNLQNGPSTATVRVHLTDKTGVSIPTMTVSHTTTDQSHGFGSMTLVSGTVKNGTWERSVTLPKDAAPGSWEVVLFPLDDTLGNGSTSFQTLDIITVKSAASSPVTPSKVVFTDKDGTANDTYTIPALKGVAYQISGKTISAGTYPGTGTVTVTAKATAGYILAPGATAKWTTTFSKNPVPVTPTKTG